MTNSAREFKTNLLHPIKFHLFLLMKLPMAWLAGLRITCLENEKAIVSVPYKWLTTNPFKSIYFACLAMAGEMSTGLLVMMHIYKHHPTISMLVVEIRGSFSKKANETIFFECLDGTQIMEAVERAKTSREGIEINTVSVGRNIHNEEIGRFEVKWSIKCKST